MNNKQTGAIILGVSFVWFTTHFGGGFASGAQIYSYFVRYGIWCLVMPALAMLYNSVFFAYSLRFARKHEVYDYRSYNNAFYGRFAPIFSNLFEVLYICVMCAAPAVAFATGGATLSELTGTAIEGEYQMIAAIREMSRMKQEYEQVLGALASVRMKGYGVVTPTRDEIKLDEPVVIKQGSKFGVKIHSEAPSIHMIRANIETEIAPIVGSEQQAKDLIAYIQENQKSEEGIWDTNIFGKSVEQLVEDGIRSKLVQIGEECQEKLQETMRKIVNDSSGGMQCIII